MVYIGWVCTSSWVTKNPSQLRCDLRLCNPIKWKVVLLFFFFILSNWGSRLRKPWLQEYNIVNVIISQIYITTSHFFIPFLLTYSVDITFYFATWNSLYYLTIFKYFTVKYKCICISSVILISVHLIQKDSGDNVIYPYSRQFSLSVHLGAASYVLFQKPASFSDPFWLNFSLPKKTHEAII